MGRIFNYSTIKTCAQGHLYSNGHFHHLPLHYSPSASDVGRLEVCIPSLSSNFSLSMAARAEGDTGENGNEIWTTLRAGTAEPTLGCIGETSNIWNPKPTDGSQSGMCSWHHLAPPTVDIRITAEPPWGTFIYQKRRGGQSSVRDVWLLRFHCCS